MTEEAKKNTGRRDRLQQIEADIQVQWREERVNESNPDPDRPKYFLTFPYPYANGRLHLGHGYSFTKCDFTARFKKMQGFNVLLPFGFHVTGMPICAAAERLKRELAERAETGNTEPKGQYKTLMQMGISETEIPKFVDPYYWVHFFPPYGREDLQRFGAAIDWRRTFITTDANPYYDSFIRWHFSKLYEGGYIKFGKRPSIYSPLDKQMCADHDRREGEGVGPQEYTLIKLRVLEPQLIDKQLTGKQVYLVAATLRPETMYGQTNCFVLPEGTYLAIETKNDEIFICSKRSALNMSYQNMTKIDYNNEPICTIQGQQLIGLKLHAPLAKYDYVYALPMHSIKMDKGTGVVTSVPSDAPDDWATLRDLQKKPDFFKIQKEWADFEPVRIIDIPSYSDMPALKACDEFNVKSSKDAANLKAAKDKVYLLGFYEGIMLTGPYAGLKVQEAKPLVKKDMINRGEAVVYYEPENSVISRTGDECVVALCDQWYLAYDDPTWKDVVRNHVKNNFNAYNDDVHKAVLDTVDWLREWGCSRSFGLGTRVPWDKQYLIESLSDSTIYFAFYTIVHYLQSNFNGSQKGSLDIDPQDLTLQVWDYIFKGVPYNPQTMPVPQQKLDIMRNEFLYWYPLDLRCSGKDLIKNHLTMALFNHAAVWQGQTDKLPRSYFCNGYILVDGEKMSKQLGNFYTINDLLTHVGADATRFGCAQAGDTLDDANFEFKGCDSNILKISTLLMYLERSVAAIPNYRTETKDNNVAFFDEVFLNQIYQYAALTTKAYQEMKYREVMKNGFFNLQGAKDEYLLLVGSEGPRKDLIQKYIEIQITLMYPIIPHVTEYAYRNYLLPTLQNKDKYPTHLSAYKLPDFNEFIINHNVLRDFKYYNDLMRVIRISLDKFKAPKKGKKDQQIPTIEKKITIICAKDFADWQKEVLIILNQGVIDEKGICSIDWKTAIKSNPNKRTEQIIQKQLQFANFSLSEYRTRGKEAIDPNITVNEFDLIKRFEENILKEFKFQELAIIDHLKAQESDNKALQTAAQACQPLRPSPIFE